METKENNEETLIFRYDRSRRLENAPQNVKDLCAENYKAVASKIEKSGSKGFTYSSVRITPIKKANGVDLKFSYKGNTLVVKNYTKSEFDYLFSL